VRVIVRVFICAICGHCVPRGAHDWDSIEFVEWDAGCPLCGTLGLWAYGWRVRMT